MGLRNCEKCGAVFCQAFGYESTCDKCRGIKEPKVSKKKDSDYKCVYCGGSGKIKGHTCTSCWGIGKLL